MSMRFQAQIDADGSRAKSEAEAVAGKFDRIKASAKGVTAEGTRTKAALDGIADEARDAAVALNTMDAAADNAAQAARGVQQSHTLAAGSVGNLTAQFNDIGVMLAAGQSPLQLAIQQGTQISQVLGNQGAKGAVKALGQAFMQMVSPVTLITIGSIAAGAAMIQWLTSSEEEADKLKEALDAINESTQKAQENVDVLQGGFDNSEQLRITEQIVEAEATLVAMREKLEGQSGLAGHALRNAKQRIQAQEDLVRQLRLARLENEQVLATERDITEAKKKTAEIEQARQQDMLWADLMEASLLEQATLLQLITTYGQDSARVAEFRAEMERNAFEQTLATKNVSAEVKDELRQAFEQAQSLAAVDMASGIAAASIAARNLAEHLGISLATAARIAALGNQGVPTADPSGKTYSGRGGDPRSHGGSAFDIQTADATEFLKNWKPAKKARTSSRSGSAGVREERDELAELVERLEYERDLLRETDPVQKEMLRNRKVLADATEAERAQVEQLIAMRLEEDAAMQRLSETQSYFGETSFDALDDFILQGESAKDVIDNLGDALAKAALQALWLGKGPLAGLFGTSEDGGLFGMLLGGLTGRADGGMIYGTGGPRDDKQLIKASPGEYIVNAHATARHRALLEAINAGAILPARASGGPVGDPIVQSAASSQSSAGRGSLQIDVAPSPLFEIKVRETAQDTTSTGLAEYDRNVLPSSMRRVSADPRRIG